MAQEEKKGLANLLSESFTLFVGHIHKFLTISLLVYTPLSIVYVALFSDVNMQAIVQSRGANLPEYFFLRLGIYFLFGIFSAIFYQLVIIKAIQSVDRREEKGIDVLVKEAVPSTGGFFKLTILILFKIFLWTLLFIIPGIVFSVFYALANMAYVVDGQKGKSALILSKRLVEPNFFKFVGYSLVVMLLTIPFSWMSYLVIGGLLGTKANSAGLLPTLGEALINLFTVILSGFSMTVFYFLYKEFKKISGAVI